MSRHEPTPEDVAEAFRLLGINPSDTIEFTIRKDRKVWKALTVDLLVCVRRDDGSRILNGDKTGFETVLMSYDIPVPKINSHE